MKIAIVASMPKSVYSGGRYCAWILAEALAMMENQVFFITDNIPLFYDDFKEYKNHKQIQLIDYQNYDISLKDVKKLDYTIFIPSLSKRSLMDRLSLNLAVKKDAKLAFINFETPNWFNLYSPVKRDEKFYRGPKKICRYGCLILSIAEESEKYAKLFYDQYQDRTYFEAWPPPINTIVADQVQTEKENQVITMVRFSDEHKGGRDLIDSLGECLAGWKVVIVAGNGEVDQKYIKELEQGRIKYGYDYQILKQLSDYDKFKEIKKSKILLFPSYFEGYGYPPIEAQYCNTACVAYDLPVLREISGDNLIYCRYGDVEDFKKKIEEAVSLPEKEYRSQIEEKADVRIAAERIQDILTKYAKEDWRNKRLYFIRKLLIPFYKMDKGFKKSYWCFSILVTVKNSILYGKCETKDEMLREKRWSDFNRAVKNKKLAVFGVGAALNDFNRKYGRKYKVELALDNNSRLWGQPLNGKGVLFVKEPEELKGPDREDYVILITSMNYFNEIAAQLSQMGIKEYYSLAMLESRTPAGYFWRAVYRCTHKRDKV